MSKYISFPLDETWYTAEAEQLYNSNRTNGVFSANDEFLTTFKAGMTVTVSTGRAWLHIAKFKGFVFGSFENVDLTLDIGDGILNRIDRIVIRYDVVNNTTTLQILKGTPAQNPTPPNIIRDELTYYDLCIAQITVNAGVITLNQGMIADKRLDETLCGVVKDGIESIPTQALQSQWEGWFNALTTKGTTDWNNWYNTNTSNFANQFNTWYNTNTALFGNRFNTWFATVQNTLSGDVAGNLLTLINNFRADVPNIKVNNAVNADKLNNKTDEDFTKVLGETRIGIPDASQFYTGNLKNNQIGFFLENDNIVNLPFKNSSGILKNIKIDSSKEIAYKIETINKNGDTMQGILTAQSNTSYTTRQVRNIILSATDADVNQMQNGDIWIKYK